MFPLNFKVLETRSEVPPAAEAPNVTSGDLWSDPDFPPDVALPGMSGMEWKRPSEFASEPLLFTDGTTRFDIGQGAAGTCWFLSILSALADREEFLKEVGINLRSPLLGLLG